MGAAKISSAHQLSIVLQGNRHHAREAMCAEFGKAFEAPVVGCPLMQHYGGGALQKVAWRLQILPVGVSGRQPSPCRQARERLARLEAINVGSGSVRLGQG